MNKKPGKSLTYHISLTANLLKVALQRHLRTSGFDITPEQLAVLNLLSTQSECVSMQFVSHGTFRDSSAVTRIIDNLERKKYVECVSSLTDKRVRLICISKLGIQAFEKASDVAIEHVYQSLQGIEEPDKERMVTILIQIQNNLIEV